MTKHLLAAAAALALAAPAAASAQTIGHLGAAYARSNTDIDGLGDLDIDAAQLEGAVRFDAGSLGAQFDGSVTRADGEGGDETTLTFTGHLNTKTRAGLVGGFAGVAHTEDADLFAAGVEGQFDLTDSTSLYGQLGYGKSNEVDVDGWAVRGELRHFYGDNFKVQASLGALKLDTGFGDADSWNAGLEAEYQFAGTPWSVVGGYDHVDSDDFGLSDDTFRIGVRFTFGGTLKARDEAGADLGTVSTLFGGALR